MTTSFKIQLIALCGILASCGSVKEVIDKPIVVTEETADSEYDLLYRINICSMENGKLVLKPATKNSIHTKNVHVITHGWAPGYEDAVRNYPATRQKPFLLAWDPLAVSDTSRYFVYDFFPLAESIIHADPTSTVLVFSWIDQSASSYEDPWFGEDNTQTAGLEMTKGLVLMLDTSLDHQIHLLGHSYGAKVVSYSGIYMKTDVHVSMVHLTLFDSPERTPLYLAENHLADLLPSFAPNRTKFFVDNYISYYDVCLSDKQSRLAQVIDVTLLSFDYKCKSLLKRGVSCVSCAHSYGIEWYTNVTKNGRQFGAWWSPLLNGSAAGLSNFYLQSPTVETIVEAVPHCADVIYKESKCD